MEDKQKNSMKHILLSAFACDPTKGSEMGNGWNWATGLAKKEFKVDCITRNIARKQIDSHVKQQNLTFHYLTLPFGLERLYGMSKAGMYIYYLMWQWCAYLLAKKLNREYNFDLVHHVTWGSIQLGSFMYKLDVPLIFGPAGGGQVAPVAFRKYFLHHWGVEEKREKISRFLLRYNPACKKMLAKARLILVSNQDTNTLVAKNGGINIKFALDAALSNEFYPRDFIKNKPKSGHLKLLWVGRLMPRKGILLLIEVMKELADVPGITLTVVGDGEMKIALLEKVSEYNLQSTIDWKGNVEFSTIRDYYNSHDAFIFTSLRDSGGVQLVEAMAFGLPVITLNLHGQSVIVNDEIGMVCDCLTPNIAIQSLKNAILEFYHYPDIVLKKGNAAHEFALKQNWEKKIGYIVDNYYSNL